jgi:hypothetical protein
MTYDGTTLNVTGDTNVTGAFTAASKSFDIPHPTKQGYRLRYGVLEGAEHGVYFRGITTSKTIQLPDYWTELVHEDSFTVQFTPIGDTTIHYLVKVENNVVHLDSETGIIKACFIVQAERKDVEKVLLEYKIEK